MNDLTLHVGDCREILRTLPDESVQCCVTSPPYYRLRDYGVDAQIGQENSPEHFIQELVSVFRELRRVLKSDGCCFVNIGDSYAGAAGGNQGKNGQRASRTHTARMETKLVPGGLAAKQLMGIPWRLAFGLQADGWWLRQDVIWSKPNPMCESVTDRFTKSHEYIFLLTKSKSYFWNAEAVQEPISEESRSRYQRAVTNKESYDPSRHKTGDFTGHNSPMQVLTRAAANVAAKGTRNKRSVWTIPTFPFDGAHFATMPPEVVKPCILAGTRPGDTVCDPFGGSGTTGQVAIELGRKAVLIELNPDYAKLIRRRTSVTPGLAL